jgi:hypothetical protein
MNNEEALPLFLPYLSSYENHILDIHKNKTSHNIQCKKNIFALQFRGDFIVAENRKSAKCKNCAYKRTHSLPKKQKQLIFIRIFRNTQKSY